jgi:hypothetical protein
MKIPKVGEWCCAILQCKIFSRNTRVVFALIQWAILFLRTHTVELFRWLLVAASIGILSASHLTSYQTSARALVSSDLYQYVAIVTVSNQAVQLKELANSLAWGVWARSVHPHPSINSSNKFDKVLGAYEDQGEWHLPNGRMTFSILTVLCLACYTRSQPWVLESSAAYKISLCKLMGLISVLGSSDFSMGSLLRPLQGDCHDPSVTLDLRLNRCSKGKVKGPYHRAAGCWP